VGRVDAFAIEGLEMWFYSSDHLPAHIHISRPGEWEIRVYLLECTEGHLAYDRVRGGGPSKGHRRMILEGVLQHRVALLEEWERKVCPSN
jgi:hypothetical protein